MQNLEWRDKLALAVAYRMHAIDSSLSVEAANKKVREFMVYGPNSDDSGAVMRATFELLGSALESFGPIVKIVVTLMSEAVEREISNGEAIAAGTAPA